MPIRQMTYYTRDGVRKNMTASTASRLAYVKEHAAVGKRTTDGFHPSWREQDIEALEKAGLWVVAWDEPTESKPERGWMITGITEMGAELLEKWNALQPS